MLLNIIIAVILGVTFVPATGYLIEGIKTRGTTEKHPEARKFGFALAIVVLTFGAFFNEGRYLVTVGVFFFFCLILAAVIMAFFVKLHDSERPSFQTKGVLIYLGIVAVLLLSIYFR